MIRYQKAKLQYYNMNYQLSKKTILDLFRKYEQESKTKKLIKKAQSLYLMHSFKIKCLPSLQAQSFHDRLVQKYESGEFQINVNDWHKNQRRLFLWYLICYCEQNQVSIQNITMKEWQNMSKIFFNKNPLFLKFQGLTIFKNIKKHDWSTEDDRLLEKCVEYMQNNTEISTINHGTKQDQGKFISSKQCRQRWFNYICKNINRSQWTTQQDLKIFQLIQQLQGRKWSQIARRLNTHRTEHMVKNRFVSLINKARVSKKQSEQSLIKKVVQNLKQSIEINTGSNQSKQTKDFKNQIPMIIDTVRNQNRGVVPNSQFNSKHLYSEIWEFQEKLKNQQANDKNQGKINDCKSKIQQQGQHPNQSQTYSEIIDGSYITSTTPSTVRTISPRIFNLFNFGMQSKRRQDHGQLFSPFLLSPGLANFQGYGTSPFPGFDVAFRRAQSIEPPVGHSQLSSFYESIVSQKPLQPQKKNEPKTQL